MSTPQVSSVKTQAKHRDRIKKTNLDNYNKTGISAHDYKNCRDRTTVFHNIIAMIPWSATSSYTEEPTHLFVAHYTTSPAISPSQEKVDLVSRRRLADVTRRHRGGSIEDLQKGKSDLDRTLGSKRRPSPPTASWFSPALQKKSITASINHRGSPVRVSTAHRTAHIELGF